MFMTKNNKVVFILDIIYRLFLSETIADYFMRVVCSRLIFDMGGDSVSLSTIKFSEW